MKEKVEILFRAVEELTSLDRYSSFEDPDHCLISSKSVIATYCGNPYLRTNTQPSQVVGVVGNRIIGAVGALPMRMVADGKSYETSANPDTWVNPDFRKTGLALDLIEAGRNMSPDKIAVDFYVSRVARKVAGLMGSAVFTISQFALVRKSAEFFAQRMSSYLVWMVCPMLDILFAVHRIAVGLIVSAKTRGWRIEDVSNAAGFCVFASLVALDKHRFREEVSTTYLKWLFANDFDTVEMADKHLWKVSKGDDVYGYVLTRVSNRGKRTRLIEWQSTDGNEDLLPWMMLKIATCVLRKTNAVVLSVSSEDVPIVRVFKRLLPRIPDQAATVGVGDCSSLEQHQGWRIQNNWRIRPAMGDCGFY